MGHPKSDFDLVRDDRKRAWGNHGEHHTLCFLVCGRVGNRHRGHYTRLQLQASSSSDLRSDISQPSNPEEHGARGFRFAIVASRWNDSLVTKLIEGAQQALHESAAAADAIEIFRVPGSFEIPLCALKAAETKKFDAVICLGVIIRGETPHFEYVARATTDGIREAGMKTGVPVLFGVITADDIEQAQGRAGERVDNKGYEAAMAAIEVVNLYRESFDQ